MTVSNERPIARRGDAERDRGVRDPGAVEVNGEPELARSLDDRLELVERPDGAAGAVVGVLERDDRRPRRVEAVVGLNRGADLLGATAARGSPGARASAAPSAWPRPPSSEIMMCAVSSTTSSVPRAPRIASAIWFAIVAVGR